MLITLLIHKLLRPEQDIRKHQATNMAGGFAARSFDEKFITPTLKELGLPSVAATGWQTRSLEQPHPYTLVSLVILLSKTIINFYCQML